MAANEDPKDIASADKAYQAAVEATPIKAAESTSKVDSAKEPEAKAAPAKPAETKPEPKGAKVEPGPAATKAKPATASRKAAAKPKPKSAKAKPAAKATPKAAAKPAETAKPVAKTKPVAKAKPAKKKEVPVKAAAPKPAVKVAGAKDKAVSAATTSPKAAAPKAAKPAAKPAFAEFFSNFMLEDKTMDMSANFSGFQDAMTEAQAKAKDVFEKSTKMFGEAGDFAKGNVEAVMESSKIMAEGMQSLGSEIVTESRSAFETMSGDIKELAAAKSPTDFFKIQGDMMRKSFDSAVAYSSKNSEAMLKLASDVMAPISGRVSMAMEKARSTSL
ncbi:phasin family protein [Novosphingobium malaysiense]|uniref:Phasin n=1 Tax=Novosphingobium malaysiense TaxID=1348853 RepID=A0A0B1ZMY4_9SPHN|nr:phasin family protein [Novosphingobium malaysiense]KHK92515.1 phasin [Novosphingobium malaysiense]